MWEQFTGGALLFTCLIVVKLQFRMILTSMSLSDEHNCSNTNILTKGGLQFFKAWKSSGFYGAPSWQILPIGTNLMTTTMMMTMTGWPYLASTSDAPTLSRHHPHNRKESKTTKKVKWASIFFVLVCISTNTMCFSSVLGHCLWFDCVRNVTKC